HRLFVPADERRLGGQNLVETRRGLRAGRVQHLPQLGHPGEVARRVVQLRQAAELQAERLGRGLRGRGILRPLGGGDRGEKGGERQSANPASHWWSLGAVSVRKTSGM